MGSGSQSNYSMAEILQLFYQEPQVVMWNCSDFEIENMKARQRKKSVSRLDKDEEEVKRNENEPSIKMEEDIFIDDVVYSDDTWQEQSSSSISQNSNMNLDIERSSQGNKRKYDGEHFLENTVCSSGYNLAQTDLVKKENDPTLQSNYTNKLLKTTEEEAGVCRKYMSNISNLRSDILRLPGSEVVPRQTVYAKKTSQVSAHQMCGIVQMYFNCIREAQEREKQALYVEVYLGKESENNEVILPDKTSSYTEASDDDKEKVSVNVPETKTDICLNEATSRIMSLKLKSCRSNTTSRKLIIEMSKIVIDVVIKLQIFYEEALEKEPNKIRCSLKGAQNYIKFAKPVALNIHKILMTRFTYQDLLDKVFQNISCLISQTQTKFIMTKSTIVDIMYVVLESDPDFVDRVRNNLHKPLSLLNEHDHGSNKNANKRIIEVRFNQASQKLKPYVVTNVKIVSDDHILYEETQKTTHLPEKLSINNGANQDRECQYITSIVAQPATCRFAPRAFPVQTPLSSLRFLYKNKCFAQNGKHIQYAPGVISQSPTVELTQNHNTSFKPDELRVLGKVYQKQREPASYLNHTTNPIARNIFQYKNESRCPAICPSTGVTFSEFNSISRSINDMPTSELTRNLEEPPKIVAIFAARQINRREEIVCNQSSKHTLKKAKLLIDDGRVFWKDTLTSQKDADFKVVSGNADDPSGMGSSKGILGAPNVVADSKGRLVYVDHRRTLVENTHHLSTFQKSTDSPLQRTDNRLGHLEVTRNVPAPLKLDHSSYQRSGSYLPNSVYERNVDGHWSMVKNKPLRRVSAASALDVTANDVLIGKGPRDCTKDAYVRKRADVSSISLDSLRCMRCSKAATVTCAGCKTRFYCSENCQRRDWALYHGVRCGKFGI